MKYLRMVLYNQLLITLLSPVFFNNYLQTSCRDNINETKYDTTESAFFSNLQTTKHNLSKTFKTKTKTTVIAKNFTTFFNYAFVSVLIVLKPSDNLLIRPTN